VPVEQQIVYVKDMDFSEVRTTAGDLNGADLARVMEDEGPLHGIATPAIEIIGKRRAIVFASSVAHAERLCEIFNRHREGMADWVCGKTDKERRRELLANFSSGKIQIICNCGVLTEGFDDPGVEIIIMGRPTKSRSLYAQMAGRSMRTLPGLVDHLDTAEERKASIAASTKPSCLIVDFVGNSGRHKLMTSADILGGKVSDEAVEAAIRHARRTGQPVRMDALLDEKEEEMRQAKLRDAAQRARLMARAEWRMKTVNPFDVFQMEPAKPRGWDSKKQLSPKQRALLLKQGINPDGMPFTQSKQLINELFRRWEDGVCSYKQAKLLSKHGYDPNVSREEASKIIDALARNGWRRPVEMAR
jgi:type I site-specific restriction endonuclease